MEEIERKFLSALENVKNTGIVIAKLLCGENLDSKKLSDYALKKARYAEVSFRRKDVGVPVEAKPEKEFFSDFELKLLEILREEDELNIKTALDMIFEHYGIAGPKLEAKPLAEVKVSEKAPEKVEKKEKKFKTLLDFV